MSIAADALATVWGDLSDADRAEIAAQQEAERWAEAAADDRHEWPVLYRTIRQFGGINGLGQIDPADIPGGLGTPRDARGRLLPRAAAVAYDELPLMLAGAGFGDRYADMSGDELLSELRVAYDAWQSAQSARVVRTDAAPTVAPVAEPPLADIAPAPEPDSADVETAEALDAAGLIEPRPVRSAWGDLLDELAPRRAARPVVTYRRPRRARPTARDLVNRELVREADEREMLDRARAEIAREQAAAAAAGAHAAAAPAGPARFYVMSGPALEAVAPAETPPASDRARALMVGAILGTLAVSVALLAMLAASVAGIAIPGIVWPLVMSLPAIAAGILPVALPAWRAPVVSLPVRVIVRVERREAA